MSVMGRLEEIKGIDIFMEVSRRFKNENSYIFHIAGSGSFESRIKAANYDNVVYHGVLNDQELANLYGSCEHNYVAENYDNKIVTRNLYAIFQKLLNESDSPV